MSASPILLPSFQPRPEPRRTLRGAWMPVLFSILFVCCTSTSFMGGSHTQIVVNAVWRAVFGKWHWDLTAVANESCRKVGHFLGYGMIGLIFRNAWSVSLRAITSVIRSWTTPFAATLSVLSTFVVASLDEWHQRYVPGRVSSFRDVMVDTTGAIFLNLVVFAIRARRRRRLLSAA